MVFYPQTRVTPKKSIHGFDVLVEVGRLRFLEHKQISEIHSFFLRKGVVIPPRTLEHLCLRFLYYVVAVHLESVSDLALIFEKQGGYIGHVDATTTKGTPGTLLIKDGWSGIRLLAASIPTEATDFVLPYLQMIQLYFGNPIALVRDMGKGIEAAINEIFVGVYVITCHFHFLRAVGLRLFDTLYPRFRGRVYRTGVIKKLRSIRKQCTKRKASLERDQAIEFLEYLLAYKKDGNGIAYPFSLPVVDFYRRCNEIQEMTHSIILENARNNRSSPCLSRLQDALHLLRPSPVVNVRIHADFDRIMRRWQWFERVREALRYRNGPVPLNTEGSLSTKELETGRKMIDILRDDIESFIEQNDSDDCSLKQTLQGISELINERREELFVPNVTVTIDGEKQLKQLPRTNNSVEQDFRKMRRHARRIRGDMDVERSVQRDGVGLAIVANLSIDEYVQCVYGSLDLMAYRFATVSEDTLEKAKALFWK